MNGVTSGVGCVVVVITADLQPSTSANLVNMNSWTEVVKRNMKTKNLLMVETLDENEKVYDKKAELS